MVTKDNITVDLIQHHVQDMALSTAINTGDTMTNLGIFTMLKNLVGLTGVLVTSSTAVI